MVRSRCRTYASDVSTTLRISTALPLLRQGAEPHAATGPGLRGIAAHAPHAHRPAGHAPGANGECPIGPRGPRRADPALATLRLISVNHRCASLTDLERHALDGAAAAALREALLALDVEALVLDTCNRAEVYWCSRSAELDAAVKAAFLRATHDPDTAIFVNLDGEAVARHLFRVTCGLESLVLGEAEIMGQVRCALAAPGTQRNGRPGFLRGLVDAALRCGGVARAETAIGLGAMSVASGTVQELSRRMGGFEGRTILVLGAGEVGTKVARQCTAEKAARVVVLNRTLERARLVANKVKGEAGPLDRLDAELANADAVITATRAPAPLIDVARVSAALATRPTRPLFVADLSMPHGVAPGVAGVRGATVLDLTGLEYVVAENRERRLREVPRVEQVIERELSALRRRARQHMIRPILALLRDRAEAMRRSEVARAKAHGPLDDDAIERLTRRLVERLLAAPARALAHSETPVDLQHARVLHELFALPDAADPDERPGA